MEEKKERSYGFIRVIGVILMIGSVIAVTVAAILCMKQGHKDYLYYDPERGVLLPPPEFVTICKWIFWTGFAGGMMVLSHDILSGGETITKIIKTVLGALGLFLTMFLNAFMASSMYVDEGLGLMPEYEVVEVGDLGNPANGQEFILIANCKKWQTVQVYYVANYEEENRAYWVDGYDVKKTSRTYEAQTYPQGFFYDRLILIREEGREDPRAEILNLNDFPQ